MDRSHLPPELWERIVDELDVATLPTFGLVHPALYERCIHRICLITPIPRETLEEADVSISPALLPALLAHVYYHPRSLESVKCSLRRKGELVKALQDLSQIIACSSGICAVRIQDPIPFSQRPGLYVLDSEAPLAERSFAYRKLARALSLRVNLPVIFLVGGVIFTLQAQDLEYPDPTQSPTFDGRFCWIGGNYANAGHWRIPLVLWKNSLHLDERQLESTKDAEFTIIRETATDGYVFAAFNQATTTVLRLHPPMETSDLPTSMHRLASVLPYLTLPALTSLFVSTDVDADALRQMICRTPTLKLISFDGSNPLTALISALAPLRLLESVTQIRCSHPEDFPAMLDTFNTTLSAARPETGVYIRTPQTRTLTLSFVRGAAFTNALRHLARRSAWPSFCLQLEVPRDNPYPMDAKLREEDVLAEHSSLGGLSCVHGLIVSSTTHIDTKFILQWVARLPKLSSVDVRVKGFDSDDLEQLRDYLKFARPGVESVSGQRWKWT